VHLHPEVPLIALLRLMHLGIAFLLGVLGRGRRMDDRRIHNGAFAHKQSPLRKQAVDLAEQRLGELVRFAEIP
jgi:hypothetical protein